MQYLEQHPLPEHVRNTMRMRWMISYWCNYSCDFCGVPVYFTRSQRFGKQAHAFDYYSVQEWLRAFGRIREERVALAITGGETMLDYRNMVPLLNGLIGQERFDLRIYTNASWDVARYAELKRERMGFVISYHPQQTDFSSFRTRVHRLRDGGFSIISIHTVLAPENMDRTEEALHTLEDDGFTIEGLAMHATGKYTDLEYRSPRELELIREFVAPNFAYFKLKKPVTRGQACWHPSLGYDLNYDGQVRIACTPDRVNFLEAGLPERTMYAAECPHEQCESCVEMIRSLVKPPGYSRGLKTFYGKDYSEEMQALRRARVAGVPYDGDELLDGIEEHFAKIPPPAKEFVPLETLAPVDGHVFGYIDKLTGSDELQALNRSRLHLSGWAASSRTGDPVRQVDLFADGERMTSITEFYPRPEVVEVFQRPDLLNSGWRTWVFLPQLPKGVHKLVARARTEAGLTGELPPFSLEIVESA